MPRAMKRLQERWKPKEGESDNSTLEAPMGKDMKYTFKLDPQDHDHIIVSEILDGLGRGAKRKLLVSAILAYNGEEKNSTSPWQSALTKNELKSLIAEMLDERLGKKDQKPTSASAIPEKQTISQKNDPKDSDETIRDDILKGLGGFML